MWLAGELDACQSFLL